MNDKPTHEHLQRGKELYRALYKNDGLTAARLLQEIGSCDWLNVINAKSRLTAEDRFNAIGNAKDVSPYFEPEETFIAAEAGPNFERITLYKSSPKVKSDFQLRLLKTSRANKKI